MTREEVRFTRERVLERGVRWQGAEGKHAERGKVRSAQQLALAERWGQAEKGRLGLLAGLVLRLGRVRDEGVGRCGEEGERGAGWAGLVWAAGLDWFFSFSSSISFPFLFLIQTKLNLFEFKFEFEFKPHSIKNKLCTSMNAQTSST